MSLSIAPAGRPWSAMGRTSLAATMPLLDPPGDGRAGFRAAPAQESSNPTHRRVLAEVDVRCRHGGAEHPIGELIMDGAVFNPQLGMPLPSTDRVFGTSWKPVSGITKVSLRGKRARGRQVAPTSMRDSDDSCARIHGLPSLMLPHWGAVQNRALFLPRSASRSGRPRHDLGSGSSAYWLGFLVPNFLTCSRT